MGFVRAYLRASASDQDPERARDDLKRFAIDVYLDLQKYGALHACAGFGTRIRMPRPGALHFFAMTCIPNEDADKLVGLSTVCRPHFINWIQPKDRQ